MLKKFEIYFLLVQITIDMVVISTSWLLSYFIRFHLIPGGDEGLFVSFLSLLPVLLLSTLFFYKKNGLYRSQRFNSRYVEIAAVSQSHIQGLLTFIVLIYFFSPEKISRLTLGTYFLLGEFLLVFSRILIRNILRKLRANGRNLRHVLLVGDGNQLNEFIDRVKEYKDAGINILGVFDGKEDSFNQKFSHLEEAMAALNPDIIVVSYQNKSWYKVEDILKKAENHFIPIQVLPDLTYSFIGHVVEDFGGLPLLTFNRPRLTLFDHFVKRSFDFTLTLFGPNQSSHILPDVSSCTLVFYF